jgi:hypothetical protein
MAVLIYVDTSKQAGDHEHLRVFANADAAEAWFAENHPESVAFECKARERGRQLMLLSRGQSWQIFSGFLSMDRQSLV